MCDTVSEDKQRYKPC